MKVKVIYYCRTCLSKFNDGHCEGCGAALIRPLERDEEIHKNAILKILQNHRAEFIHLLETERAEHGVNHS